MCGILGFTSQQSIEKENFRRALKTLRRRGPDDEGVYEDRSANDTQVLLGNRRLAVLDLSAAGHQPMADESGDAVVTFNGEVYNYREIREDLRKKGYRFRSDTDTEVLLKGFIEYGTEIVEKLDGMFTFAIYDRRARKIFCARDHFGKKPLYYLHNEDQKTFVIASELKALKMLGSRIIRHPMSDKGLSISNLAIKQFLTLGYIPAPNSIYKEIKKLPPATALLYDLRSGRIEKQWRYWKLEEAVTKFTRGREQKKYTRRGSTISLNEAVEQLDQLLHQSVQARLISDVPLGSFLSGGIDSSLVTAIAAQHTSNLDTFTVTYEDKKIDESEFVRRATSHLGIRPHFFTLTDQGALDTLEDVLAYMDEPFADAAILPTAFLSQQTRNHVTVALSGDGGDELFGGYPKYRAQLLAESRLKPLMLRLSQKLTQLTYLHRDRGSNLSKFIWGLRYDLPVRQFYWGSGGYAPSELGNKFEILNPKSETNLNFQNSNFKNAKQAGVLDCSKLEHSNLEHCFEFCASDFGFMSRVFRQAYDYTRLFQQEDIGNLLLFLDLMIQLPDGHLTKIDRASMMNSLEARAPFLQKDLVEFLFTLPSNYKFDLFRSKKLLKKLATKYLPRKVVNRPKKGFGVPLNRWLRTVFREKVDAAANLNPKGLDWSVWRNFLNEKNHEGTKVWRLFVLSEFIKRENL